MATLQQIQQLDNEVSTAFNVLYPEFLASQDLWYQDLTFTERTRRLDLDFSWIRDTFGPKETARKQAPEYRTLLGDSYQVALRRFGDAIEVDTLELYDDRHGMVMQKVMAAVAPLSRHEQDLIVEKLEAGDTSAVQTWDGENLFANAHPKGGTTFDNLLAVGALSKTTFQAARTAMRRFPSDEGATKPLDLMPSHLAVPPDLEYTANELMNNSYVKGGSGEAENVLKGMAKVISDARFTDVNDWYLIAASTSLKPFVTVRNVEEGDPVLRSEVGVDTPAFRDNESFRWWYRYYMECAPTRPEYMLKVVVA